VVAIWAEEGRLVGLADKETRPCWLTLGRLARCGSKPGWVVCWAKARRKGEEREWACWAGFGIKRKWGIFLYEFRS
jgi:hypothetical protein